ncbi:hypothetical protein GCM10009092_03030 [Bowmanella denitrificans]|uniref:STAS domain-containing protein n=1 Tax=Bowmanella denitrificans TaxID=366582 RepID=A0ABP3GEI6_9ALTE
MSPLFRPHGHHQIEVKENVLICRVMGAWNAEQAEQFCASFTWQVKQLARQRWMRVMDMQDWELCCPDVAGIIQQMAVWEIKHGCAGRWFCHTSAMHRQLLVKKYAGLGFMELADSVPDALQLATRQLENA